MRKFAVALYALILVSFAGNAVAEDQWSDVKSPELGFSASFPAAATFKSEPNEANNIKYTANSYTVDLGERAFIITVFVYPPGSLPKNPDQAYLAGRITDFASGSGTKVRKQSAVTLSGRPGIEAITDDDARNIHYLLDVIVVGDRLYVILSGGRAGHESTPEALRFRDSFRFM